MILALLATTALASDGIVAPGNSLEGFTQVGKRKEHLYCQDHSLGELNGSVCVHGKHGVMTDSGLWSTAYVSDQGFYPMYVYRTDDPVGQATTDFMALNAHFFEQGYVMITSQEQKDGFSLLVCNQDKHCFVNALQLNRDATSVYLVVTPYNP